MTHIIKENKDTLLDAGKKVGSMFYLLIIDIMLSMLDVAK
jgi:hypothetical protein